MENKAYALAAGLFTVLLGVGVIVAAMWLSGETYERVPYVLESRHPVSGLNIQAPVRLRGVEVGKVESIGFDPADARLILVGIGVRTGTPITRGTTAQLGSQGVTGLAYVMLDDDGKKPEPMTSSSDQQARIPVRPSFLDDLSGSGKDLLTEVNQVVQRLNLLLGEKNQAQLIRTLASLEAVAKRADVLAHALEPAAGNLPALTADARKALARADTMFSELTDLSRELKQQAGALERVAKSAEQVGGSTQAVSGAVASESLPRINMLLDEMTRNSRNLDRLLTDLNDQPATLVYGRERPLPGPGEPGFTSQRGSKP
jgi:phospholipid/cholesterol/gamma-HCH transport system substrate-binding protein